VSVRLREKTHISRFADWHSYLDSALAVLPESECCPHDLYRHLCPTSRVIAHRGQDAIGFIKRYGLRRSGLAVAAKFLALLEFM